MTMSDRLAVMRHGKVEQIGEPEAVYESPATEFVAGFLGASNMLDGEVKEVRGDVSTILLDAGGTTVTIPTIRVPAGVGSAVRVGVRPEKITLEADEGNTESAMNSVTGMLRMSTYIGVSHQFTIEGPGETTLTVYAQNLGAAPPAHPGDRVRLVWRPEHTFAVEPSEIPITQEEEEGE